jgi:lipoate---protein ligase
LIGRAFRSAAADPYRNLALEESFLEKGFEGSSALFLYANEPCVVVGRNQNPWVEASEASGLPVLRRVSGGGAVYHDLGNLNWAIILPRSRHDRDAELALVVGALRDIGVDAKAGPRGGLFVSAGGPYAGAKISGTARRLTAGRVLHHGTLLVDADLARMDSSLGGLKLEASRAVSSAPSPCINLASILPGIRVEDVSGAFARVLVGASADEAADVADPAYVDEADRRLRGWDWTWGATPAFTVVVERSGGSVGIDVRGGRVASISGTGSEAIVDFIGRVFDYGLPRSCSDAMDIRGIPR